MADRRWVGRQVDDRRWVGREWMTVGGQTGG